MLHRNSAALLSLIFAGAICASTRDSVNTSKQSTAHAYQGVSYVIDASESLCGYLFSTDQDRVLLTLIKKAVAQQNPDQNTRLFLIRQRSTTHSERRDLVEAPVNLRALAESLAARPTKRGDECAPFNGIASNLDVIFDPSSKVRSSSAVVLITDGQFTDSARSSFAKGFADWARQTQALGLIPYAGIAIIPAQFLGVYYPVNESDPVAAKRGYLLPKHNRPLVIAWFARGDSELPKIHELLSSVGPQATSTSSANSLMLHLLPSVAVGIGWFKRGFRLNAGVDESLDPKVLFEPNVIDPKRSVTVVQSCLVGTLSPRAINVEAPRLCSDGRPLFDGVSDITVTFQIKSHPLYTISVKGDMTASQTLAWRLTPQSRGDIAFQLTASARRLPERSNFSALSVDSDHCSRTAARVKPDSRDTQQTWEEVCVRHLDGRVYQLDTFIDQLHTRSNVISSELLSRVYTDPFSFSFQIRK